MRLSDNEWIRVRSQLREDEPPWTSAQVQQLLVDFAKERERLKRVVSEIAELKRVLSYLRARVEDYNHTLHQLGTQTEALRQHTGLGFSKTTEPEMYEVTNTD